MVDDKTRIKLVLKQKKNYVTHNYNSSEEVAYSKLHVLTTCVG